MPVLSWLPDYGNKKKYNIIKSITTIGSEPENDICIENKGLLGFHAQLVFDGRDFILMATEAEGEIFINGKKKKKIRLSNQDVITLGEAELNFSIFSPQSVNVNSSESFDIELEGLKKLQQFSVLLLERNTIDDLLEQLMDSVIEITNASKGFLVLFEDDIPHIKVARNLQKENLGFANSQLSDSILNQVVSTQKALIVSDAQNNNKFANSQSVIDLKLNSVMCAPLMFKGQLLGLIYVGNDSIRNLFGSEQLELLIVFAAQASLLVNNAILLNDLKVKNINLSQELERKQFGEIIGSSKAMEKVFLRVEKVAPAEVSVLIGGETGTGKELIAHEIHRRSNRKNGPFVTVNCGAIPETLMESEFFGYVKGAFTGADTNRCGKFQSADKGTIFLDEIGEMPLSLQVKLLRVLQEHQVTKVGSSKTETLDIRVLAATNRNLEEEVSKGNFREDLFYRLNVIFIELPPLSKREDDCILLAKYLLKKYIEEFDATIKGFTPGAISAIRRYRWPGNVRELENRIKKAVILCDGSLIAPSDLDFTDYLPSVTPLAQAREDFLKKYINEVLVLNGGNRAKTAEDLEVDPRTIYRYLEKT